MELENLSNERMLFKLGRYYKCSGTKENIKLPKCQDGLLVEPNPTQWNLLYKSLEMLTVL